MMIIITSEQHLSKPTKDGLQHQCIPISHPLGRREVFEKLSNAKHRANNKQTESGTSNNKHKTKSKQTQHNININQTRKTTKQKQTNEKATSKQTQNT